MIYCPPEFPVVFINKFAKDEKCLKSQTNQKIIEHLQEKAAKGSAYFNKRKNLLAVIERVTNQISEAVSDYDFDFSSDEKGVPRNNVTYWLRHRDSRGLPTNDKARSFPIQVTWGISDKGFNLYGISPDRKEKRDAKPDEMEVFITEYFFGSVVKAIDTVGIPPVIG